MRIIKNTIGFYVFKIMSKIKNIIGFVFKKDTPCLIELVRWADLKGYTLHPTKTENGKIEAMLFKNNKFVKSSQFLYDDWGEAQYEVLSKLYKHFNK